MKLKAMHTAFSAAYYAKLRGAKQRLRRLVDSGQVAA
jgi:hypothetical protein